MASSSSSAINGLIEEYVSDGTPWENLPEKVKNTLGNSQQVYQEAVKTYSLDRQLPYDTSPARFTMSKQDYYNELINYLRNELRVYCIFTCFLFSNCFSQRFSLTNSQILL